MFLGIAGVLFVATYRTRQTGADWVASVPDGYGWAVVGVLAFGLGGVADFGWHSLFGFERGVEGLISPSHLLLAAGATLFLGAPLRAAWLREGRPTGLATVPVVLSAALTLTIVTTFGGVLNPLVRPYPAFASMTYPVAMLTAFPLVFVGSGIALTRRFRLPPGSLAVAFTVPGLGIATTEGHFSLAVPALVAGVVADLLAWYRPPTPANTRALRVFSAAVPVSLVAAYFAVVELRYGILRRRLHSGVVTWSPHVVGGTVVLAGAAGLLLSYLLVPGVVGADRRAARG
jgi:hypothetical protein